MMDRAALWFFIETYFRFPIIYLNFSFLVATTTALSFYFPSVLPSFVGGTTD